MLFEKCSGVMVDIAFRVPILARMQILLTGDRAQTFCNVAIGHNFDRSGNITRPAPFQNVGRRLQTVETIDQHLYYRATRLVRLGT